MTEASVTTDSRNVPDETAAFFDEVKNGRDETTEVSGGYGSYPKIRAVTVGDRTFYGFTTSLDDSRGPWLAGYRDTDDTSGSVLDQPVWFDRNTVFDAETLEQVAPNSVTAILVNALIEADAGELRTDGGEDVSEAPDESDDSEEGLGEMFG